MNGWSGIRKNRRSAPSRKKCGRICGDFSRTIPSFIMAYGDESLTLANFDKHTESDVFLEVTGITEDDFRFLRDGGDYVDPETGETQHFEGHLFNEVVCLTTPSRILEKEAAACELF